MAVIKSVVSVFLLVVAVAALTQTAESQSCWAKFSNLNVCAPFVAPGTSNVTPNTECCSALQQVDRDCLCNTLRVTAQMPTACNLPPINCARV